MEENKVTFETAKLAKEKGFDIDCKNKYIETLEHTLEMGRGGDCTFPYQAPRILSSHSYDTWDIVHCSAPTQSLLQKWLREVHNIHITILRYQKGKYYLVSVVGNDENENENDFNVKYTYFEEALECGLQQGLELVKFTFNHNINPNY